MPLYITDGTTARNLDSGVVWRSGDIGTTTVSYVDIQYSDARDAGYGYFILDLIAVRCPGKQLAMWAMQNSTTVTTAGYYGGHYAHGEADADIDAATSDNMNNASYFQLSAGRNGLESNLYLGNYTIHIKDPVSTNSPAPAYPNVYWRGTHRLETILASNIAGGGVNNRFNAHYGVRIGSDDGSAVIDRFKYKLTAYKMNPS